MPLVDNKFTGTPDEFVTELSKEDRQNLTEIDLSIPAVWDEEDKQHYLDETVIAQWGAYLNVPEQPRFQDLLTAASDCGNLTKLQINSLHYNNTKAHPIRTNAFKTLFNAFPTAQLQEFGFCDSCHAEDDLDAQEWKNYKAFLSTVLDFISKLTALRKLHLDSNNFFCMSRGELKQNEVSLLIVQALGRLTLKELDLSTNCLTDLTSENILALHVAPFTQATIAELNEDQKQVLIVQTKDKIATFKSHGYTRWVSAYETELALLLKPEEPDDVGDTISKDITFSLKLENLTPFLSSVRAALQDSRSPDATEASASSTLLLSTTACTAASAAPAPAPAAANEAQTKRKFSNTDIAGDSETESYEEDPGSQPPSPKRSRTTAPSPSSPP